METSKNSMINQCSIIELDKHKREQGNLTVVENNVNIPFSVKRIYYLYDIPGGEIRGGHGHKDLKQLIIAASGSFSVILKDGMKEKSVFLNHPYQGLLIVPGIWRELVDFSSGSVCLVLASEIYCESDYIRDFNDFLKFKSLYK